MPSKAKTIARGRPRRLREDEVGKRITEQRLRRGMTQTDLAMRAGVSQQVLSRWELGERPIPSNCLIRLANVLRVKPSILIDIGEPK